MAIVINLKVSPTAGPFAVARQAHASLFGRKHCLGVATVNHGLVHLAAASEVECAEWITAVRACPGCAHDPSSARKSRRIDIKVFEAKGVNATHTRAHM